MPSGVRLEGPVPDCRIKKIEPGPGRSLRVTNPSGEAHTNDAVISTWPSRRVKPRDFAHPVAAARETNDSIFQEEPPFDRLAYEASDHKSIVGLA
jgi:hypothetical protein